jgi:hypothetical protein
MKTRNANTTKTAKAAKTTTEWLMVKGRDGVRRIEKLGWGHLARIYNAYRPNSSVRRAINAEARRLGYAPRAIMGLGR